MKKTDEAVDVGLNVDSITFNEKGEMVVLDEQLLTLVSGGFEGEYGPSEAINIGVFCGTTINAYCPRTPKPGPKKPGPKKPGAGDDEGGGDYDGDF